MKKSYLFYIQTLFIAGSILLCSDLRAQMTLTCESGNLAIEKGNCWSFGAITYSNTASLVISGTWSTKSSSLTSQLTTACWIKSPWMLIGNGNITFRTRLDGISSGVTSKGIIVSYIPNDVLKTLGEGTPTQFYTYSFPAFNVTTIRDISIPIPDAIKNSTKTYKICISFVGAGGTERAYSDDFVIPGTYWSDPANSCLPKAVIPDADADGVPDSQDEYPTDKYRAYNSYYPSATTFGTLAFEDLWPSQGDFDFNDVVVDYQFNTVTNASNNVVEVLGKIVTKASGASFHNGFGFQIDGIPSNKVISTTGTQLSSPSIITTAANGLEANQTYATCIAFDDFFNVMAHPGVGSGINTDKTAPFVNYNTLSINITFIKDGVPATGGSVAISQLPSTAFNFFIIANQERGKEIHLANGVPTSLANTALFGTEKDDSNISTGKYYKTKTNLPWGINLIGGFSYPIEKVAIDGAYLHFNDWAQSGGTLYPTWYTNDAGNRVSTNIY